MVSNAGIQRALSSIGYEDDMSRCTQESDGRYEARNVADPQGGQIFLACSPHFSSTNRLEDPPSNNGGYGTSEEDDAEIELTRLRVRTVARALLDCLRRPFRRLCGKGWRGYE